MKKIIIFILLIFTLSNCFPQNNIYINYTPGVDIVSPSPLIINQSGYETISKWANYKSSPLKLPIYYSYRLGLNNGTKGFELEMNHLKIHLHNIDDKISIFDISHGYNQLFFNRVRYHDNIGIKAGLGIVIAHPENTVRGMKLMEKNGIFKQGYYFAGPALQYGIFKELIISKWLYFLIETRVSLAYANVPIVNGRAHAPVLAFHLQLGTGVYFKKISNK